MKQNKAKFIFDNYIVVPNYALDRVTALIHAGGVAYAVEPWPDGYSRVYVREDVKAVLRAAEQAMLDGS